jgi:phosphoribosylaminoimidazolecarboxamide formyltransferase/IMP cyclohydrolase
VAGLKTLHPRVHGGILAKRDDPSHQADLAAQAIDPIDVVVVNLYPFRETVADPGVSWAKAIENIDIGGPAMVRAAAKNHADVAVLTSPGQYEAFLAALAACRVDGALRRQLALEAFQHTASYDSAISTWMASRPELARDPPPALLRRQQLPPSAWRCPCSRACAMAKPPPGRQLVFPGRRWLGGAIQLQGKELSYNNLIDLEAALATVREFGYGPAHSSGKAPRSKTQRATSQRARAQLPRTQQFKALHSRAQRWW